jgi:hypothetical protein
MSLSLNDLKKSERPVKSEEKEAASTGSASEDWSRSTKTSRPWATDGLVAKGPKGRKARAELSDLAMNSEWANEHTSSINAFDMEVPSALTQLRDLQISLIEQAVEMERKIKRAAKSPFQIMRSVLSLVQK